MRIAYLCHWNLDHGDGVAKKIETQARIWRDLGHEALLFALSPGDAHDREGVRAFPYGRRAAATRALARAVRAWRPDAVYLRYDVFLPPVWSLARARRTVVEVNSDDRVEMRKWRGRAAVAYNELNRRMVLGGASGIVYVTGELQHSASFASYAGTPSIVVANGVELDGAEPVAQPGSEPRVVFLGSPRQPWHGVDKLAALARAMPELAVDLVGYSEEQLRVSVPDIPPNVQVHGPLTRDRYEPLLDAADAGIGTLALHRKEMREAAPLKVREYLAHGLPVVIAYDDVDLANVDAWWLLRLPNREGDVDVDAVRAFLHDVRGRRVPREEVAPLVSSEAKERKRLAFVEEIAR